MSLTSVQQHHTVIRPVSRLRHRFDLFPMIKPFKIFLFRNSIIIRSNYLIIHVHGHSESKDILISTLRRSHRSHVLRPHFSNYNDTLRSVQPKIVRVRQFDHCLSKRAIYAPMLMEIDAETWSHAEFHPKIM